jgi:hypothetical protein
VRLNSQFSYLVCTNLSKSMNVFLVLARDDDDDIPRRGGSYDSNSLRRRSLASGIAVCEKAEGGDKLGLGLSFVPLAHPLPNHKSGKCHPKTEPQSRNSQTRFRARRRTACLIEEDRRHWHTNIL